MKKLLVLGVLALLWPATASAAVPPSYAGQCGIPATQPVWFDYGWPMDAFNALLSKPGLAVGSSGGAYGTQLRAAGVATPYFDLNFNNRVGTTIKPADPSTIADKAQRLFAYAQMQTACATPVIVLNELSGPSLVTPWSDTNAQYRQNALAFVQDLTQLGAHPVLLLPARPYTGGDAGVWWQQAAASAELVREVYVPATATWKLGPVLGNRTLRNMYRQSVTDFTSLGISPNKLGLMISFSSTPGFGGRNGLQPVSAWYEVAKWQALAAQQVASELGIASLWSWGWAEWTAPEQDPDKPYAMCAWLWARSSTLCDAAKAIQGFDTSRTEGQLSVLGAGAQCVVGKQVLTNGAIAQLQALTGDRDTAYSALFERMVESPAQPVSAADVLAAERAVIRQAFRGSRSLYVAALAKAGASVLVAHGILADELRRAKVESWLPSAAPSVSDVQTFYSSYPDLQVRMVQARPAPFWLGNRTQGLALSEVAPPKLFDLPTGRSSSVLTSQGSYTVKALQDALPLGAVPLGQARPAILAALRAFARGVAFEHWTVAKQRGALNTATCARDDLPQPAAVDLVQYLPFLRLG